MERKAYINSVHTEVPRFTNSAEAHLKWDLALRRKVGQSEEVIAFCEKIEKAMHIDRRYSIHPFYNGVDTWADQNIPIPEDIFTPHNYNPPIGLRLKLWAQELLPVAVKAAAGAIKKWGGDPQTITHVITATTTGWVEPGMAAKVITDLDLPYTTEKTEIVFNGCFSGMTALRVARDTVLADQKRVVLVVAAESATTHFGMPTEPAHLLSSFLFGDGAGAAIISAKGSWEMAESGSFLIPNTLKKMTFHQSYDSNFDGFRIFLSPQIPEIIDRTLKTDLGKSIMAKVTPRSAQNPYTKIAAHPGGRAILDAIRDLAVEQGWPEDSLEEAYAALRKVGNLAAAAIFFVLEYYVGRDVPERELISFGFGPGMTTEWGILRRTD